MKKCKGCSAVLQKTDKTKAGYVIDLNHDYCLNCFSLKHYNRPIEEITKVHFPHVPNDALIVYLISAFHLNELFKFDLKKFYPSQNIILLINKIDLLPKTVNFDKAIEQIKKEAKQYHVEFLEVMPISALKGNYLDIFLETIVHYGHEKIYFVGLQNSGKSTLLNKIALTEDIKEIALTSKFPGLTKDNIAYKYKNQIIVDTPGVFQNGFISDYLQYHDYQDLIISKKVKPVNFYLNSNQAIVVGGFLIISFIKGKKTNFSFYLGNVNLHRTKFENVFDIYNKHKNDLFKPVIDYEYEKVYFKLDKNIKYTINIFDLGYLVVKGPITLELYAPKKANITLKEGAISGL